MHEIHTAATCLENPGPAAWAAVISGPGGTETISGAEPDTTANRMALVAVIEGLERVPEGADVAVISASRYVVSGATRWMQRWKRNGWTASGGRKPVANEDLWRTINSLSSARDVEWRHARRGDGDPALSDARRAAREALRRVTE